MPPGISISPKRAAKNVLAVQTVENAHITVAVAAVAAAHKITVRKNKLKAWLFKVPRFILTQMGEPWVEPSLLTKGKAKGHAQFKRRPLACKIIYNGEFLDSQVSLD